MKIILARKYMNGDITYYKHLRDGVRYGNVQATHQTKKNINKHK